MRYVAVAVSQFWRQIVISYRISIWRHCKANWTKEYREKKNPMKLIKAKRICSLLLVVYLFLSRWMPHNSICLCEYFHYNSNRPEKRLCRGMIEAINSWKSGCACADGPISMIWQTENLLFFHFHSSNNIVYRFNGIVITFELSIFSKWFTILILAVLFHRLIKSLLHCLLFH